MTENKQEARCS